MCALGTENNTRCIVSFTFARGTRARLFLFTEPQPFLRRLEVCKFLDGEVGTQDVEVPFSERKVVLN